MPCDNRENKYFSFLMIFIRHTLLLCICLKSGKIDALFSTFRALLTLLSHTFYMPPLNFYRGEDQIVMNPNK